VVPPHAQEVPFLFQQRQGRLSGALGASFLSHVALFFFLIFLARVLPEQAYTPALTDPKNYEIVWLPSPGPGGGGGGGGNKTPEPPKKVEAPGKEKITVPVTKPAPVAPIEEPKNDPPPVQELTIPAKTMESGEIPAPGVLEGTTASTSLGSGSGSGAGTGTGSGIGEGSGSGLGQGTGGGVGGGVYRPGNGVENPRLLYQQRPNYTPDAMRAKIQGTVLLEAVVMPDGRVGQVEVVKSLDSVFGLDQEAIKAAKQWRFEPGRRFGQPVPVLVTIELTFTLR
jgi:TonB family protein